MHWLFIQAAGALNQSNLECALQWFGVKLYPVEVWYKTQNPYSSHKYMRLTTFYHMAFSFYYMYNLTFTYLRKTFAGVRNLITWSSFGLQNTIPPSCDGQSKPALSLSLEGPSPTSTGTDGCGTKLLKGTSHTIFTSPRIRKTKENCLHTYKHSFLCMLEQFLCLFICM